MMWSSFTWKISSVFSKILLVSQREKMGITPVNPEQACPLQERLFSTEPTLIISLIAATRTISFLLSEWLWARWAASCKTQTFVSLALHPHNYLLTIVSTFYISCWEMSSKKSLNQNFQIFKTWTQNHSDFAAVNLLLSVDWNSQNKKAKTKEPQHFSCDASTIISVRNDV